MRCIDSVRWSSWLVAAVLAGCSAPSQQQQQPGAPAPGAARPVPGVATVQSHRNLDALRLYAAARMVEVNPERTYTSRPPEVLLAIPVLEIELNADGSIRRIDVLRHPRQALDTTQLAIDAVRRAAPFGDVSRLPRPWKFTETFLFNDERKFKPRTLDS